MRQSIYFSKSLTIAELRKCPNIVISEQQRLYEDSNKATYTISYKEDSKEHAYIIFDDYYKVNEAQYGDDCEYCAFYRIENYYENISHILATLYGVFDITFARDEDEYSNKTFGYMQTLGEDAIPLYLRVNHNIKVAKDKGMLTYMGGYNALQTALQSTTLTNKNIGNFYIIDTNETKEIVVHNKTYELEKGYTVFITDIIDGKIFSVNVYSSEMVLQK